MELDARITELVALGASVTANCQPCLEYHADKAREGGATEPEIAAAIEVGRMVRKGAASKMDKLIARLHGVAPASASSACCQQ